MEVSGDRHRLDIGSNQWVWSASPGSCQSHAHDLNVSGPDRAANVRFLQRPDLVERFRR